MPEQNVLFWLWLLLIALVGILAIIGDRNDGF